MALRFLNSGYFAGKVGIGTESPVAKLELGTNDFIMVNAGAGGRAGILFNETGTPSATNVQYGARISYKENGDVLELVTRENNVDKLGIAIARLTGYVGIGTDTSINNPLTVSKDAGGNALAYFNSLNTNGYGVAIRTADAGNDKYVLRLDSAYSSEPVMYASNAGNVGIGTTSPGAKLEVAGTGDLSFKINNTQYNRSLIIEQGGGYSHLKASHVSGIAINYGQGNPGILSLFNNTTQAVKINTNGTSYLNGGNVGIGTTSPGEPLTVKTKTDAYFPGIKVEDYNSTMGLYVQNIEGQNSGIGTGRYYNSGNWRSDVTAPTTIRFDGGAIRFYAQSGVTADANYTPTQRMIINGNGAISLNAYGLGNFGGSGGFLLGVNTSGGVYEANAADLPGGPYLPLAGGTMTGTNGIIFPDNFNLKIGTGSDLQIYHSGTESKINNDVGNLSITNFANDSDIIFSSDNGVGGTTPYLVLDGSTTHAYFTNPGNVGIGTTNPVAKLDVKSSSSNSTPFQVTNSSDTDAIFSILEDGGGDGRARIFNAAGTLNVNLDSSGNSYLNGGNVGIGTTNPDHKLDVDGNIGLNQYLYKNGDNDHYIRYTGSKTEIQSPSTIDFRLGANSQPQGGDFQFASDSGDDFTISYTRTGNAVFKQIFSGQAMHWQNNVLDTVYYANNNGNVGIGTTSPSEKLDVAGNIKIQSALLSNQENTDIDTGVEVVAQVSTSTYTAAFFDFVVKKGTNVRSGTVYACHNGDSTPLVEFTETSTNDLGDTSDVTLSVDISGTNMRLLATVTSDDWSVKSLIRAI